MGNYACYVCNKFFDDSYTRSRHVCFESHMPDPSDQRIRELERQVAEHGSIQNDYDAVVDERDSLHTEVERLTGQRDEFKAAYELHSRHAVEWCAEADSLRAELQTAREALEKCRNECSMDDPNFGNFTPLMFAARLGLIYQYCESALKGTPNHPEREASPSGGTDSAEIFPPGNKKVGG